MLKVCRKCNDEFYLDSFPKVNNKHTNRCYNCTREYHKEWRELTRERKKRREWRMP